MDDASGIAEPRICGVIPAFNSQATIAKVVARTRVYVEQVVVVDDGSQDHTARRARQAGAHVLASRVNRGKGYCLGLAFAYALNHGFDAVVTLDADLQHNPDEVLKFIDRFQQNRADLIVGNRMHNQSAIPRVRRLPNQVGNKCFTWLTGQPILDSQSGFRLYSHRLLATLPVLTDGFESESDLLLRAGRRGFKIDFVPIEAIYFSNNGHKVSFYRPIRDTYYICINFLKNWFWQQR